MIPACLMEYIITYSNICMNIYIFVPVQCTSGFFLFFFDFMVKTYFRMICRDEDTHLPYPMV